MIKPKMQISNKVKEIPEALSIYINSLVYKMKRNGNKVTTLSLGEAFFDIPFFGFDDIDIKKGYHYSESMGLPELRIKLSDYYEKQYGAKINPNNELLISAGSKPIIYMALQAVLNDGDEVLIHEPAWVSYSEQIKLAGGVPKFIPFDSKISEFENFITDKTKVLILNNPNNPAGRVYSPEDLKEIYRVFRSKGIYILMDEAYSDFLEKGKFTSLASIVPDKDGIIVVNSLSKNLGISGWRVGYVVSTPEIIFNILKLNQHLITCPPTILLMYLEKYFERILDVTLPQAKEVTVKRNKLEKYVREIGLDTLGGSATFYMFINIDNYSHSSLDFAMYLLFKYNIAVVPGSAYGESTERFIRIGVGVETFENLCKAVDTIKKVIENNEYDYDFVEDMMHTLDIKEFES